MFEVQLGQALSTRPDILPTVYCQELVKLQVTRFLSMSPFASSHLSKRYNFYWDISLYLVLIVLDFMLQDQIPPFPTHIAINSIESQLGVPVSEIFADISPEPIAAASLGQVYKG